MLGIYSITTVVAHAAAKPIGEVPANPTTEARLTGDDAPVSNGRSPPLKRRLPETRGRDQSLLVEAPVVG